MSWVSCRIMTIQYFISSNMNSYHKNKNFIRKPPTLIREQDNKRSSKWNWIISEEDEWLIYTVPSSTSRINIWRKSFFCLFRPFVSLNINTLRLKEYKCVPNRNDLFSNAAMIWHLTYSFTQKLWFSVPQLASWQLQFQTEPMN